MRLIGLALSFAVAAVFVGPWISDMRRAGLARDNFRGRRVAFPAGAVLIVCSLIALAPLAILDDRADLDLLDPDLRRWAVYVLGVALLGLLDDALGAHDSAPRGWRGHARAIAAGRFSTGAIKAVGALALAAYATSGLGDRDFAYVADLLLLLLTTNLFNLLDLRPGRSAKALLLLGAALSLGALSVHGLWTVGLFLGPVLILLPLDLRERGMLGDTGSNAIGAIAGVWLVVTLSTLGQAIALGVMAVATVYGEFRSISALVERTPGLRHIDSLGRSTHA